MVSKFLQVMRPFMSITPEVHKPEREVKFNEKVIWTLVALIVYYLMTQVPIYGVEIDDPAGSDPFFWVRTIMASSRGTLAELGIGPIVTAGLIMQILTGSQIIRVDMNDPEERALYTGAQKVLSVFMTIFEGMAYIIGGAYPGADSLGDQLLILSQLIAAGVAIILMDEMVQKGWGLGSGISLFIAGGVATQIFWGLFATVGGSDDLYRGSVLALLQAISEDGVIDGIDKTFIRKGGEPDVLGIFSTVIAFVAVIYFESMRVEIPVSYAKYRGFRGKYPIKLLYVSNIPVILVSAVFADIYFVVQMLANTYNKDNSNVFLNLLGEFYWPGDILPDGGAAQRATPKSGLVYFITPPRGPSAVLEDIPHALVYAFIMIILAIGFSAMWIETAGMGPRDVAHQLISAGMQIPGWRSSQKIIEKRLAMYIPTAALLGGLFIGVLAASADFMGALGTGTGILLSVSIMRQYFEILVKERAAEMHPALRDFLGIM
ncbi:MAG: preprotein translocase subunit SecY [Candidatus Hodarchaeota archaeon]